MGLTLYGIMKLFEMFLQEASSNLYSELYANGVEVVTMGIIEQEPYNGIIVVYLQYRRHIKLVKKLFPNYYRGYVIKCVYCGHVKPNL